MDKVVLGWREEVHFPVWGCSVVAKVDTGARTSAIHVEDIVEIGENHLSFDLVTKRKEPGNRTRVEAEWVRKAQVRSSSGKIQTRYVVRATAIIGTLEKDIELSLVSRPKMICRMLLGRLALEKDFVVDVSHRHLMRNK
ncbi:MAG: RimK/LysX family protein [Fimbriimonadaceae bacterium]|jgi:hypothetical protein|nr:RimK/LysX family protein [Fimbriimonadaceae bacterium]